MCTPFTLYRLYHLGRRLHSGINHFPRWQGSRCHEKTASALWKRCCISRQTELRMYLAIIASELLYGSDTWNLTTHDCNRSNAFHMSCLCRLGHVKWYQHVRNFTIRQQTKQRPVSHTLTQRRLRWFGHLQRMPPENEVLKLHNFFPATIGWIRPRGRPQQRWLDCVTQYLAVIDLPSQRQFMSPIIASHGVPFFSV